MNLAIMQPYFFPYLGYVQLMQLADVFVIYDDVNFIKQGWINRNTILSAQGPQRFTVALKEASSNKKINEICLGSNRSKLVRTIEVNYRRAPFFQEVMPFVELCLNSKINNLAEWLEFTLLQLSDLLGITTKFLVASRMENSFSDLAGQNRVIAICRALGADTYINPEGGMGLYSGRDFFNHGITLRFLKHEARGYRQFPKRDSFVPNLSVLDVLMFVGPQGVRDRHEDFRLLRASD